jgi:hypothetical protein
VLEITNDEARSAKIMAGTTAQDYGTIGNHREVGVVHRVVAAIVHADSEGLGIGLANHQAQFVLFHADKMANESDSVNAMVPAVQEQRSFQP